MEYLPFLVDILATLEFQIGIINKNWDGSRVLLMRLCTPTTPPK
jgi:hypothetical protein